MTILILGSQGFIGSNLVAHFVAAGNAVTGCDLVEHVSTNYSYQKVSVLSPDFDTLFLSKRYDVCINAAGSANVSFSIDHPISDFEANTMSVAKVLDTIHKYQPTCRYVHISSAAVYGNPVELPIKESSRIAPLSPYGFHKWMSEILCREYYQLYNIPVVILRPFSVYGNGLKKQLFWDICQKLKYHDSIQLYGTGNESRDFIHVNDLCSLISKIIQHSSFDADVYNVATGKEMIIREIANIFTSVFPGKKQINFSAEFKPGDPANWRADISKIREFGFNAVVSLENGIRDYINWCIK